MTGFPPVKKAKIRLGRKALRLLWWLPVPVLLYWAFRGVSFREIVSALGRLSPGNLTALLVLNLAFSAALAFRWILILRGLGEELTARKGLSLAMARLGGFAVSYLTPGPQFGGEPVQLVLAYRWTGLSYERGSASLLIDRSFELAGNFAFIGLCLPMIASLPAFASMSGHTIWLGPVLLSGGIVLALLPLAYLAAVFSGFRPLSRVVDRLPGRFRADGRHARLATFIRSAETEVAAYGRHPFRAFFHLAFSSITILALAVLELWMVLRYLDIPLGLGLTALVLAGSKLALYIPVPGGFGALEGMQRALLSMLGYGAGTALALSAYVRLRDLLFTLSGLVAIAIGFWTPRHPGKVK